jgi:uncharacterized protein (TIGR02270 family)
MPTRHPSRRLLALRRYERCALSVLRLHVSLPRARLTSDASQMSQPPRKPALVWRLVEESLSEAAYLWLRLDAALDAHDHTLADVERWVEGRLLGALDGVLVAGEAAIEPLLTDALLDVDLGSVSAAAYVLSMLSHQKTDEVLEQALRRVAPAQVHAFARGLGRAAQTQSLHDLWARLQDASPLAQAAVVEALAFCGATPNAEWGALLCDADSQLRCAAASAIRFVPLAARDATLIAGMESPDIAVSNRALAAGVMAGSRRSWLRCVERVKSLDVECAPLLVLVAMLGSAREVSYIIDALGVPELRPDALRALGFAGTCDAVEACLTQLRTGQYVQVAADAVAAITGLDLKSASPHAANALEIDVDEDVAASASELDRDDRRATMAKPATERGWPMPGVAAVDQWWADQRARFDTETRYIAGQALTGERLLHALTHGPNHRRHALAAELSARSAGAHALQTLAFSRHQRQQLAQCSALTQTELRDAARSLGVQPWMES